MQKGTTYYISAVAGNDDGSGAVDLADSCLSVANGQPVIFLSRPLAVQSFQGPSEVCGNEDFFLSVSDPTGNDDIQYQWHLPTGTIISTKEKELTVTPGSALFTGDYFVVRDSLGCLSDPSSPIFIEILTLDVDIINAGRDTVLCGGNSFQLEATSSSNLDGRWVALQGGTISSPNSLSTQVGNLQAGNNEFVWEVDLDGCRAAASDTVNIIIEQAPLTQNDFFVLNLSLIHI